MAATNDVKIRILVDGKQVDVSLDELKTKMQGTGGAGSTAGTSIAGGMKMAYLGVMAAIAAVAGLAIGLSKAVNLASDMNEEVAKMNVVFAGAADKAFDFRDKLHDAYNMSYLEATKLMGRTGDLMTGFGATRDRAADLAFQVNALAADLVSFKNIEGGVQSASDAITKAMMGERESAKQLGIVIRETDVQARLAAEGKDKLTGNARNLAMAETTLNIIYEQQKNAIGDLERTQDSYANQQRKAKAAMEDIGMTIGSILLPLWNKLIVAVNDFLDWIKPERIAGVLNAAYEVIKTYVQEVIKQFEILNTVLKLMAIAVDEAIKGNLSGAAALTDAAMKYYADKWSEAVVNISDAAARGYEEGVNNFKEFLRGMKSEADSSGADVEAMTKEQIEKLNKYQDELYKSGQLTQQGYVDLLNTRLEKAKESYGQESLEYLQIQEQIRQIDIDTAEAYVKSQDEKFLATSEANQQMYQDWANLKNQEFEDTLAFEQAKIDALYENGELSNEIYGQILQQRLMNAAATYGTESKIYSDLQNRLFSFTRNREIQERAARQQTTQMAMDAGAALLNALSGQSRKAFEVAKAYNIAKAIMDALAGANAALKNALLPPPLNIFQAMATLAYGYANVAQIRSQKYTAHAEGGIIDRPMMGLIGEEGEPEIIAPKKNFIEVTNELINRGEIGGGDMSAIIERLEILNQTMANLKLEASLDPRGMSIVVEKGNKLITGSRF